MQPPSAGRDRPARLLSLLSLSTRIPPLMSIVTFPNLNYFSPYASTTVRHPEPHLSRYSKPCSMSIPVPHSPLHSSSPADQPPCPTLQNNQYAENSPSAQSPFTPATCNTPNYKPNSTSQCVIALNLLSSVCQDFCGFPIVHAFRVLCAFLFFSFICLVS